mmetsp:Transcript_19803/g.31005  ORF Transcript_19803/g.31005 Transcript_19803/m.31005 type:complete len:232 (-) Transcript_19803:133-828(-)|eukprot:CAMPEP_0201512976 /NCGR_PEP_ID=MMETSP0161_2-20130828/5128_1 /ASSEMBLY_ACC=CAM_ASM_000251 /TAXON_ID=180227 /ORGANISM="Neoparamoeba aestuarina, Strain SoJaBio B1-5/56/2" /LENGTH=231 /DNA_ID=CAMNT_0047909019 /DNA_START=27 /DNA_END=722 /DNA_ORIENTATION=+
MTWTLLLFCIGALRFMCHDPETARVLVHQRDLLERVFSDVHMNALQEYSRGKNAGEICEWEVEAHRCEIGCTIEGILYRFEVQGFEDTIGQFALSFFPNSIQLLDVVRCQQRSEIITRHFPREAIDISLSVNSLYGTPDLTTLPERLESLFLTRNNLSGPITLCHLPQSLRGLYLGENRIEQEYVPYAHLPPPLHTVNFEGNIIGGVHAEDGTERVLKKSIFKGMKKKDAH